MTAELVEKPGQNQEHRTVQEVKNLVAEAEYDGEFHKLGNFGNPESNEEPNHKEKLGKLINNVQFDYFRRNDEFKELMDISYDSENGTLTIKVPHKLELGESSSEDSGEISIDSGTYIFNAEDTESPKEQFTTLQNIKKWLDNYSSLSASEKEFFAS